MSGNVGNFCLPIRNTTDPYFSAFDGLLHPLIINICTLILLFLLFCLLRKLYWTVGKHSDQLHAKIWTSFFTRDSTRPDQSNSAISPDETYSTSVSSQAKNNEASDVGTEADGASSHQKTNPPPGRGGSFNDGGQTGVNLTHANVNTNASHNCASQEAQNDADEQPLLKGRGASLRADPSHTGFFSWIPIYLRLSDADIEERCGKDAMLYLRFQRYLILYGVITCLLVLFIILPINLFTSGIPSDDTFGKTTVSNMIENSPFFWAHFVVSVTLFVLGFCLMYHFLSTATILPDRLHLVQRTIMISNVPKKKCTVDNIRTHFQQAYPECKVTSLTIAHNVSRLVKLSERLAITQEALEYYKRQLHFAQTTADHAPGPVEARPSSPPQVENALPGITSATETSPRQRIGRCEEVKRPLMYPYHCAWLCSCCACCSSCCTCGPCAQKVDAAEFYEKEVSHLKFKIDEASKKAYHHKRLGIAFVTFERPEMADLVLADFVYLPKGVARGRAAASATTVVHFGDSLEEPPQTYYGCSCSPCCYGRVYRGSTVSKGLDITAWAVRRAPSPSNINWGNLSTPVFVWRLRSFAINLLILIITLFFTTPTVVLGFINNVGYQITANAIDIQGFPLLNQVLSTYLPSLMLALSSSIMPILVSHLDKLSGFWTKSAAYRSSMLKIFSFLILMVLILPSLGLTTANSLVSELLEPNQATHVRWQCFFLPGNGAFFMAYMMTSSMTTTMLDLLCFADIFLYVFKTMWSRSEAERFLAANPAIEFAYGDNFAWMLCIFCVFIVYCIPTPLIAPFGLLYLVLKHMTDRYNMYYTYRPSRITYQILRTAVAFFITAITLMQLNIAILVYFKSKYSYYLQAFSTLWFLTSLLISLLAVWVPSMKLLPLPPRPSIPPIPPTSIGDLPEFVPVVEGLAPPDLEADWNFVVPASGDEQTQPPEDITLSPLSSSAPSSVTSATHSRQPSSGQGLDFHSPTHSNYGAINARINPDANSHR